MKNKKSVSSKNRQFISYFQSVITMGILTDAKNKKEAEEKARLKLKDKDSVNYCLFDQTGFELFKSEEWKPQFISGTETETLGNPDCLKFTFNPTPDIKNIIASRLQKKPVNLTTEDLTQFVKESLKMSMKETNQCGGKCDTCKASKRE